MFGVHLLSYVDISTEKSLFTSSDHYICSLILTLKCLTTHLISNVFDFFRRVTFMYTAFEVVFNESSFASVAGLYLSVNHELGLVISGSSYIPGLEHRLFAGVCNIT